jgi:hypothetical protein
MAKRAAMIVDRRRSIPRHLLWVSALVLLVWSAGPRSAHAVTDLGQICLGIGNHGIVNMSIRLALTALDGPAPMASVVFRWRFPSPTFQIVGTGAITDSPTSPGSYDLVLSGIMTTTEPDVLLPPGVGVKTCSAFATLHPPSFAGFFLSTCVGDGLTAGVSGLVSRVSCDSLPGAFRP